MTHGVLTGDQAGVLNPAGQRVYGLVAEFERAEQVLAAAQKVHDAGYRRIDAYSPLPVEGLSEALGFHDFHVPRLMLAGGFLGCLAGASLLFYCMSIAYPLNVGGQPLNSWPTYIPISFECTVLFSALSGVFGMIMLNGLPQPYHPIFDAANFDRASSDRFFLCIEAEDPRFDLAETRRFLESLTPAVVSEVELRK